MDFGSRISKFGMRRGGRRPLITHLSSLITLLFAAGCGGSGVLHVVPLNQGRIEKQEPLLIQVGPAACGYALDGQTITIGLERENVSLIGGYGKRLETVSIVVEGLPAGKARDYKLNRASVRGRLRVGAQHERFASISGILALWFEPNGILRGRIRALVKLQEFNVIMGWTGEARALLVGDFTAVRAPARALAVRMRSEADGLAREEGPDRPRASAITGPDPTERPSESVEIPSPDPSSRPGRN